MVTLTAGQRRYLGDVLGAMPEPHRAACQAVGLPSVSSGLGRPILFQRRHLQEVAYLVAQVRPEPIRSAVAERLATALAPCNVDGGRGPTGGMGFNRSRFVAACVTGVDPGAPRRRRRGRWCDDQIVGAGGRTV